MLVMAAAIALLLFLPACSRAPESANTTTVDINAAAAAAQHDVDSYAANKAAAARSGSDTR